MALIHAQSKCAICGESLARPYTATSGCAFGAEHELFPFCDAPLHWDCLATWPHRIVFSEAYFQTALKSYQSGRGTLLHRAQAWFLACGPIAGEHLPEIPALGVRPGEPAFAEIRLREWPGRLSSRWRDWDEFMVGGFGAALRGPESFAFEEAMAEVSALVPTSAALRALLVARLEASASSS